MALNSIKLHFSQVYNISLNPIKRMKKTILFQSSLDMSINPIKLMTNIQGVPKTWEFNDNLDIVFVMN